MLTAVMKPAHKTAIFFGKCRHKLYYQQLNVFLVHQELITVGGKRMINY